MYNVALLTIFRRFERVLIVSNIFILIYYKKLSDAFKIGFFYGVNIYKINIYKINIYKISYKYLNHKKPNTTYLKKIFLSRVG